MATLGWVLYTALQIYIYLLIARMVISWIPLVAGAWKPRGFVSSCFEIVYTLTDPPIKLLRKIIPPLDLGGLSLDLAFMAVLVIVYVLQRAILIIF